MRTEAGSFVSAALFGSESGAESAMGSSVEVGFRVEWSMWMRFLVVIFECEVFYKRRVFGSAANKIKVIEF